jgi:hypothetical protein
VPAGRGARSLRVFDIAGAGAFTFWQKPYIDRNFPGCKKGQTDFTKSLQNLTYQRTTATVVILADRKNAPTFVSPTRYWAATKSKIWSV